MIAGLTIAQVGHPQSCEPSSKEMDQYLTQRNWKPRAVTDPGGAPEVDGYVDEQNRFYFESLTRSGDFPVAVTVDPNNKDYKDFFKYCRSSDRQGTYLRSMRQSRSGNKYAAAYVTYPT